MIKKLIKSFLPVSMQSFLKRLIIPETTISPKPSKSRQESNSWLKHHASDIVGSVLSIGSGTDEDKEGGRYRDYFINCSSYITSEITSEFEVDMVLDIRSMTQIQNNSFDCVFCSGVLEHVDDYRSGLKEITRILKCGGILLLGLPFRQAIHLAPNDYWRFTEYGIKYLLRDDYEILELTPIDNSVSGFPAAYWIKAKKR
ncbi:MAG: methyltransferase domain-containing protein [Xenococcaceae cyanobacterium MO_188.B29]|nr:methyltransferase domain-containing protein [Xenococcaceae cyanobacterium MO_188.B29]